MDAKKIKTFLEGALAVIWPLAGLTFIYRVYKEKMSPALATSISEWIMSGIAIWGTIYIRETCVLKCKCECDCGNR